MVATAPTPTATIGVTRPGWRPAHYLALVGAALVGVQLYVYGAWLADGPTQVTQFRDHHDTSWTMARVYEVGVAAIFAVCVVYVVRQCVRERRLTFDAKLMIAGCSVIWLDEWTNILSPIWFYSSQWLNLTNPLAHLPGHVNPDIGRLPFPAFHFLNYPVALFGAGVIVSGVIRWMRARWPRLSTAQTLLVVFVAGMVFDVVYEIPMFRFHLWAFAGIPDWPTLLRVPIFEIVPAGVAFASFGALRYFKDDQGREVTERGLERTPARWRAWVSTFALIGLVQLLWLVNTSGQAVIGTMFSAPYKPMPAHLVNDACDAPLSGGGQVHGTRYGPCPGSPGFRLPVRHSLP